MELSEYKNIFENEQSHFFYKANHQAVINFVKKYLKKSFEKKIKILDAGCGTGLLTRRLSQYGDVIGVDISDEALKFSKRRRVKVKKASIIKLPFKDNSFDLITCIDVIYHKDITDDKKALKELFRVLKIGGIIIIRVSANKWLKSFYDKQIHLRQRYDFNELKNKLLWSGFEIKKLSFINMFLLPPVAVAYLFEKIVPSRNLSPLIKLPTHINKLLFFLLTVENYLLNYFNLPFGLGILAVCKK